MTSLACARPESLSRRTSSRYIGSQSVKQNACFTFLFLVLLKEVHYLLKSVSIVGVDDDFIEISVDASASEDVLDRCPYSLEDVMLPIEMHRDKGAWTFCCLLVCRDDELMTWVAALADEKFFYFKSSHSLLIIRFFVLFQLLLELLYLIETAAVLRAEVAVFLS